jgi:diguanylate cyclase (GGDEF)-like protein
MAMIIDPHERFIRRTALVLLLPASLGAAFAAVSYNRQVAPQLIDLIITSGLAVTFIGLFIYLWLRPGSLSTVSWMGFVASVLGLAAPAWFYTIQAWHTPGASLVATYPPISSILVPPILALIVFMRPRRVLPVAVVSWILVAGPILVYLLSHPRELASMRGQEMLITLGPVVMVLLAYIPFQHGIERWVGLLQNERAKMQALAERDGLTGLYNRRAGENLLVNLVAAPETSDALILFDIDHFKRVNDSHGHPVGDEVLRQVARRCEALLRHEDVFARWGGEEFLVLVRGARENAGVHVAESLRVAISASPIAPVGTVTASFGLARFRPFDSLESWLHRADSALYAAKAAGRDRVVGDHDRTAV